MFHTSVQTHIPQDVLGRVHAYDAAGSLVMKPVGQAVAGPFAVVAGTVPLLCVSASMALVACALLAFHWWKATRRQTVAHRVRAAAA